MKDTYKDFLKSEKWRKIRRRFKKLNKEKGCYLCGSENGIQIHHATYERHKDRETKFDVINDLYILCAKHHKRVHRVQKKLKIDVLSATKFVFRAYGKELRKKDIYKTKKQVVSQNTKNNKTRYKIRNHKKQRYSEKSTLLQQYQEAVYNLHKMLRKHRIKKEEFDEKIKYYNERIKKV